MCVRSLHVDLTPFSEPLQGHARARGSYLRSHCQTLIAKVALFEQRLLADSYTSSSVPALDTLAQELTGAIEEAERNSQQVRVCI